MVDDNTSEEFVEMVEDESPKKPSTLSGIPLIQWSDLSNITLLRHGTGTSVYSATLEKSDLHLPQNVIIKTPREGLRAQAIHDVTMELKQEAHLLQHFRHPNIVHLYGEGTIVLRNETIVYYVVIERLAETLSERLARSQSRNVRKNCEAAVPMLVDLANALCYLHEGNPQTIYVHRDVKPDNIGFTAGGVLKIFDFGLSGNLPRAEYGKPRINPPQHSVVAANADVVLGSDGRVDGQYSTAANDGLLMHEMQMMQQHQLGLQPLEATPLTHSTGTEGTAYVVSRLGLTGVKGSVRVPGFGMLIWFSCL